MSATGALHARPATPGRAGRPPAVPSNPTRAIVEAITTAIVEHRLAPGAKLTEQTLAGIYGVSRTIVRQALFQLERDHLVTLEPARGAFIAAPSVQEARQVFAVRRHMEQYLVGVFCEQATQADFRALREHIAQEQELVVRTDVRGRTRLLGDFHVLMARRVGLDVLAQLLSELISRCALITLMYQSSRAAQHSSDEHVAILRALEMRDAPLARSLMEQHLAATEDSLLYHPRTPGADLHEALGHGRQGPGLVGPRASRS
ncbi:MAG: GntR family transcriptional regulator [Betaproteobacteria bacterium]|nr:GntR family transcriptional regulator [Betaproteobacteria bacterium]MBU6510978.1 GntR family transcriptional regulator [Betaproteobacteria bacterium]MDE1954590.1 GntR family transcriptional regulator [Betaproteobacteria bacterium]MDE2154135.1 GntR family transcriptional regulator [Betaproteobacteria bacterium]MDE2480356.1 GntR family transcriptional regulator [Betaproteobacteria bacterium]